MPVVRDQSIKEMASRPFLSIVVAVRNEAQFIEEVLDQLANQDYPSDYFEILVVDGLSIDDTQARVRKFMVANDEVNISLLQNEKSIASAGRNLGISRAQGDYVVIIDGHVHIDNKDLLNKIARVIELKNARVLGRPQSLAPPGISRFQLAVNVARSSPIAHSQESFIYSKLDRWVSPLSVGVIYHRSIFEEFGHFDESFDAAEDVEFNYRLEKKGVECFLSEGLKVNYYPRKSMRELFVQMFRYGKGRIRFVLKHPERFTLETIVPAVFFLTGFTLFLAMHAFSVAEAAFLIFSSVYFAVVFCEGVRINFGHRKHFYFLVPLIILCVHIGLAIGSLTGIFEALFRKPTAARDMPV